MGSLAVLANAVATGNVGARELVALSIDRIERLDVAIGAVVAMGAEEALEEARLIDERVAGGDAMGPLAGIPMLVKDVTDVEGMRTTFGSRWFVDAAPAVADALVPARLRAAGAVVVGKTNTPEFATEGYSSNLVFGTTRNPWSLDHSPGGSSGGSGAALAAGLAPIATAADGGGSVRIPAAWSGLAGLKPTAGIVGRAPIPDWIDFSTDGPLGCSVDDVRLLLRLMAGPTPGDPTALPAVVPVASTMPERIYAVARFADWGPLPTDVSEVFERALVRAEEVFGVAIEPLETAAVFRTGNVDKDWFTIAGPEHAHRLGRKRIEQHGDVLHPATRAFLTEGLAVSLEDHLAARRRRFDYVRELDLLIDGAVILSPVMAIGSCPADGVMPGASEPGLAPYVYVTQTQNMTGHPAISVPAGTMGDGVPFGLQITGPRFADELVLDLAAQWEEAEPWPATAPGYEPFET